MRVNTWRRWLLACLLLSGGAQAADPDCALLTYGSGIDGSTDCVSLSTTAGSFNGLLRNEGSEVGFILMHGRNTAFAGDPMVNHPDAVVVRQLRTHLAGLGYSTLSIETPNIPLSANLNTNTTADFHEYDNNNASLTAEAFARVNAAINELAAQSVKRVVLAGFSLGSRYATAATAAAELGLLGNSLDVVGLLGVGMYSNLVFSTPTAASPTSLTDINGYDTLNNLGFVTVPVLDVYGDLDGQAATTALARALGFGGGAGDYTQASLSCPDFVGQSYYFQRNGSVTLGNVYNENRCHQLRNGYLYNGVGFDFDIGLVGDASRPLESTVTSWLDANAGFAAGVPLPPSALLFGAGLLGLGAWRRAA